MHAHEAPVIVIAQVAMHWTLEDNLAQIEAAMRRAQAEGASICAFAELALTGFHRGIVTEGVPGKVDPAVRPDPDKPPIDPPEHVQDAMRLARDSGAWVVQTNWPNALNRPEESLHCGASACISPAGELMVRLPEQACGLGLVVLGERTVRWLSS